MIIVGEADLCDFFVDPIFPLIFSLVPIFHVLYPFLSFSHFSAVRANDKTRKIVEQFLLQQMTISFL